MYMHNLNTRLMNKNKAHCNGDFHRYPVKEKATSMEAVVEFKHPLFQLELNTKHNGRSFTRYPVNSSDKTLGRARDPRTNGAWLNKLTE